MALAARHVSDRPARRTAVHLWFRSRRRRRSVSSRRRRVLRRYGPTWWALTGSAFLFLAVGGYLTVTAMMVRGEVADLQQSLGTVQQFVREGKFDDAQRAAAQAGPAAARAHSLTGGPVWAAAAAVPWVGSPLASVRDTTAAVDQLAGSVLPSLSSVAGALDPAALRPDGRTVDVATLQRVAPALHTASVQAYEVTRLISAAPDHTWLPVVDTADHIEIPHGDHAAPFRVSLHPLARGPLRASLAPLAELAIVVRQPPRRVPEEDARRLMGVLKLTPAEAALAAALAAGASLAAHARERGVQKSTVRTQLKALFAKTETSRQGALVAALRQNLDVTLM